MYKVTLWDRALNVTDIGFAETEEEAKRLAEQHYGTPEMTWHRRPDGVSWADEEGDGTPLAASVEYHVQKES